MKEFDPQLLAEFDGLNGKPVYIAHGGRVIDVTRSELWKTGRHMNRHRAGKDLTADMEAAPHGLEVLDRYPQVGILKKKEEYERPISKTLARLLSRFPVLRRHPHPMVVHFPIVFMYAAPLFNLLYLFTGVESFEVTALHCLGGGILFTPFAMLTGWFTWWLNYAARPMRPVAIKIRLSILLLCVAVAVFIWRLLHPQILTPFAAGSIVYFLLLFSLIPIVTLIGWYGAQLTFPMEKKQK